MPTTPVGKVQLLPVLLGLKSPYNSNRTTSRAGKLRILMGPHHNQPTPPGKPPCHSIHLDLHYRHLPKLYLPTLCLHNRPPHHPLVAGKHPTLTPPRQPPIQFLTTWLRPCLLHLNSQIIHIPNSKAQALPILAHHNPLLTILQHTSAIRASQIPRARSR